MAVTILATAFTIIWTTFSVSLDGWRRGQVALDRLHHGDFVMEQVVSGLRSAAHFQTRPEKYGFWLEDHGERDEVSWVTSGSAFMKPEDPLARGLHRLWIGIAENENGDDAFAVRAYAHFSEELEPDDVDPWFISSRVEGLDCKVWNNEQEDWEDEWEDTNTVPPLVQVTLYLKPLERGGEQIKMSRLVEIPVGPSTTGKVQRTTGGGETAPATNQAPGSATGGTSAQPTGTTPAPAGGSDSTGIGGMRVVP